MRRRVLFSVFAWVALAAMPARAAAPILWLPADERPTLEVTRIRGTFRASTRGSVFLEHTCEKGCDLSEMKVDLGGWMRSSARSAAHCVQVDLESVAPDSAELRYAVTSKGGAADSASSKLTGGRLSDPSFVTASFKLCVDLEEP